MEEQARLMSKSRQSSADTGERRRQREVKRECLCFLMVEIEITDGNNSLPTACLKCSIYINSIQTC